MNVAEQVDCFQGVLYTPDDLAEPRPILNSTDTARPFNCLARELSGHVAHLEKLNAESFHVYIGVNPRRRRGERGDEAIALARVLYADFDWLAPIEASRRIRAAGLPEPTLVVSSGHGTHVYWRLVEPITDMAGWREFQKDLAALLGSDPRVSNPERLTRLPGFWNWKDPPALCEIFSCEPAIYHLGDLNVPMRDGSDTLAPVYRVRMRWQDEKLPCGTDRLERARRYLSKCPPAISGQGGHRATWYASNCLNRFGLTRDEALDVLRWFNAEKCDPPWSERELLHKVNDAYDRHAGEHGQKLAVAG